MSRYGFRLKGKILQVEANGSNEMDRHKVVAASNLESIQIGNPKDGNTPQKWWKLQVNKIFYLKLTETIKDTQVQGHSSQQQGRPEWSQRQNIFNKNSVKR